jgi:hypothetical protein
MPRLVGHATQSPHCTTISPGPSPSDISGAPTRRVPPRKARTQPEGLSTCALLLSKHSTFACILSTSLLLLVAIHYRQKRLRRLREACPGSIVPA